MQRHEPELAGVGRCTGDDDAARREERIESVHCRSSTRASTATGRPSNTMSGLTSTAATPCSVSARRESASSTLAHRGAVDGGLAAYGAEQRLAPQLVEHVVGVVGGDRHEAERDVGQRLGEHPADADHHARPELRVGVHARDELARAGDHGRDDQGDRAVVGRGRGEQLAGGGPYCRGVGEPEPHQPTLGLVGDGVAGELDHHRVPELVGRVDRRRGVTDETLVDDGDAVPSDHAEGIGLGEGLPHHTAVSRPAQYSSRSTRLRSLPDSVRGSSSRTS